MSLPQVSRRSPVEAEARQILNQLWLLEGKPAADHFYPIKVDRIVRDICGFGVTEFRNAAPIIGIVDRGNCHVGVASGLPLSVRRFTLAHEVGHILLHPKVTYHRERSFLGGITRPPKKWNRTSLPSLC